jgi:hypothetical protein
MDTLAEKVAHRNIAVGNMPEIDVIILIIRNLRTMEVEESNFFFRLLESF